MGTIDDQPGVPPAAPQATQLERVCERMGQIQREIQADVDRHREGQFNPLEGTAWAAGYVAGEKSVSERMDVQLVAALEESRAPARPHPADPRVDDGKPEIELRLDREALGWLSLLVREHRLKLKPESNPILDVLQDGVDRLLLQTIKIKRVSLLGEAAVVRPHPADTHKCPEHGECWCEYEPQPLGAGMDRGRTVAAADTSRHDAGAIHVYSREDPTWLCAACREQWQASNNSYLLATSEVEAAVVRPHPRATEKLNAMIDAKDELGKVVRPHLDPQSWTEEDQREADIAQAVDRAAAEHRAAVARSHPDPPPSEITTLDALRAYGDEEIAAALKAKNREQYLFWQGWDAALRRLTPAAAQASPRGQEPTSE